MDKVFKDLFETVMNFLIHEASEELIIGVLHLILAFHLGSFLIITTESLVACLYNMDLEYDV